MILLFGQANDGAIRNIGWLLESCQLDRFIAVSYGAQQKIAASIEFSIEKFGYASRKHRELFPWLREHLLLFLTQPEI